MSEWLDLELSHHLAPTEAPNALWCRVCAARGPKPGPVFAFPIAAVVTLILAGALYFIARGEPAPARYRAYSYVDRSESCVLCHTTI